ncbi:MAG: glycosyltransferase [Candidatus Saccharibacteria bacterium]|nr:glycosyltransferase [Candidatus Saccharibacteria bacterium]
MKITVLSSLPPTKGVSKYTAGLLGGLHKHTEVEAVGFKRMYPEFLYPGGTKDDSLKPIYLEGVKVRNTLTWYNPFGWVWAGLTIKGDVVHAQWWSYVLAPVYATILFIAKFIRRKKIIITIHNVKPHEQGFIKNLANKIIFALGDKFIVHTKQNKKELTKSFKIPASKVTVISHGVLMPDVPIRDTTKKQARKQLGIADNKKVLLFFGIIRDYKGLDVLLSALAEVKKQVPEVLLLIAGKPWEGWSKYQRIIDKNNLQDTVKTDLRFIPEEDIEMYFAATDLVVLPYKHFDAQSGAGSLALPFGKAMLVTDNGGLSELVKDEAAVVEPNSKKDLSKKIVSVLNDSELRKKLDKDSLDLAKQLSWDEIAKETRKLYKKLM